MRPKEAIGGLALLLLGYGLPSAFHIDDRIGIASVLIGIVLLAIACRGWLFVARPIRCPVRWWLHLWLSCSCSGTAEKESTAAVEHIAEGWYGRNTTTQGTGCNHLTRAASNSG